jgi:spoIIIJ-associated protein
MDERTTLEVIAPSVEEAIAQGLAQLGLPADAVSVEVLDAGSKGLFGLGGRQVRVRLTVNGPGAPKSPPATTPKASTPKAKTKQAKPKRAPAPSTERAKPEEALPTQPEPPVPAQAEQPDQVIESTEQVVSKLLSLMGLQAQVTASYGESDRQERQPVHVDVRGDDLGVLIGHRSETLNAFQYIASLVVSKQMEQWVQVIMDVEGYRSRRERQLRQMARRMAEQAVKTGRRQVLEPMPPNERRIIHLELRDHPKVYTESVGADPRRKVTILLKEAAQESDAEEAA